MAGQESDKLLRVKDLVKVYKAGDVEVRALRGITMEVEQGEFLAVTGSSGSGKSTFMNILGCLDIPTSGSYWIDGQDVSRLNRNQLAELRNRKLGFIFQSFNILPRTSALENVELPLLYNRTVNVRERRQRASDALIKVGLQDKIASMPNQLSGGQQQRVAIARALINNPRLILADEPTGNLDTRTSYEIMAVFQSLNDKGITIMMVTHEPDIAQFAKRKIIFRDGRITVDERISNRKLAEEELKHMPVLTADETV